MTGFLTKTTNYASNIYFTISDITPVNLNENLPSESTASSVTFTGSYPMSADSNVSTSITPLPNFASSDPDIAYFTTFSNLDFQIALQSLP